MKKLMLLMVFAGIGLFATADSRKAGRYVSPKKLKIKKPPATGYSLVFHCPSGDVTWCCYATVAAAMAAITPANVRAACGL